MSRRHFPSKTLVSDRPHLDLNNLPKACYIDPKKKRTTFSPEADIVLARYDAALWKKKFPLDLKKNVDMAKLQLTNIGLYSIATPQISLEMVNFVDELCQRYNIRDPSITESNGGLGGFTIRLAHKYNTVNVVEINSQHANIIKNNLDAYKIGTKKRITIYIEDYLDIFTELKNDVIICDPPWGGYSYSKKKSIHLSLNNINIACIVNILLERNLFKIFILMAPRNFNISYFIDVVSMNRTNRIIIHNLGKHYFIAIINMNS